MATRRAEGLVKKWGQRWSLITRRCDLSDDDGGVDDRVGVSNGSGNDEKIRKRILNRAILTESLDY